LESFPSSTHKVVENISSTGKTRKTATKKCRSCAIKAHFPLECGIRGPAALPVTPDCQAQSVFNIPHRQFRSDDTSSKTSPAAKAPVRPPQITNGQHSARQQQNLTGASIVEDIFFLTLTSEPDKKMRKH
jgi:hypothetical protein